MSVTAEAAGDEKTHPNTCLNLHFKTKDLTEYFAFT
jgi:hypothetical protein